MSPLLDKVIRWFAFIILGAYVLYSFVIPVFYFSFMFLGLADHTIWGEKWRHEKKIERSILKNGIVTGGEPSDLAVQFLRLKPFLALSGSVNRNIDVLNVVLVETEPSDLKYMNSSFEQRNGHLYRVVDVDLLDSKRSALLLIADDLISWKISNPGPNFQGQLGFEGDLPFNIKNAAKGSIAGMRITSFGADVATTPKDFRKRNCYRNRKKFCKSLEQWREQFSLNMSDIKIWHFTNPTSIAPLSDYLTGVASEESDVLRADEFCRQDVMKEINRSC